MAWSEAMRLRYAEKMRAWNLENKPWERVRNPGPKTPAGKAAVSLNGLKDGARSRDGARSLAEWLESLRRLMG